MPAVQLPREQSRARLRGRDALSQPGRVECVFVDPIRDASLKVAVPAEGGRGVTLGEVVASYRSAELEAGDVERGLELEQGRFANGLFLLTDEGVLGELSDCA